jgi:hypothetical protein|tara:strand:- start:236 stop:649 length:414 start_codon:yes stop_codon:yes gene_type:complete
MASIQQTFRNIDAKIDKQLDDQMKVKAEEIAAFVVVQSPVYSGAYVESFSILKPGSGGGRSRSSDARKMKSRTTDPDKHRMIALNQMYSDIDGLENIIGEGFMLKNRSPHVRVVENGSSSQKVPKYNIFGAVRREFG